MSSIFYLFQWQQQILSQIRKHRARLRKKLHYPRYKGWHLSVLKTLKSRGWPAEATLTNPLLFFLFDFFSFLFLSLMPSKMGGKPRHHLSRFTAMHNALTTRQPEAWIYLISQRSRRQQQFPDVCKEYGSFKGKPCLYPKMHRGRMKFLGSLLRS